MASIAGYSDAADRICEISNGSGCRAVVLFLLSLRVREEYASKVVAQEVLCDVSRETLVRREGYAAETSRNRRRLITNGVAPWGDRYRKGWVFTAAGFALGGSGFGLRNRSGIMRTTERSVVFQSPDEEGSFEAATPRLRDGDVSRETFFWKMVFFSGTRAELPLETLM